MHLSLYLSPPHSSSFSVYSLLFHLFLIPVSQLQNVTYFRTEGVRNITAGIN
uniref:Uncharacterized protein n=1 Tax=Arundo donax TaxID=35708 RepID=A0A0A9GPB7_ARUDO